MKALLLPLAIISLAEGNAAAQEKTAPPPDPAADSAEATLGQNSHDVAQEPPQTLENTIEAEQSSEPPQRRLVISGRLSQAHGIRRRPGGLGTSISFLLY